MPLNVVEVFLNVFLVLMSASVGACVGVGASVGVILSLNCPNMETNNGPCLVWPVSRPI